MPRCPNACFGLYLLPISGGPSAISAILELETMPRLLVVDDEPEVCRAFAQALNTAGFAVHTCVNGTEAVEFYRRKRADVVFCDLRMPGIDGLAVLDAVKGMDPWATVVMVTAYGTIDTATHALRLGAYDFLEKPCTISQIQQVAARALDHRKQLKELTLLQGAPGRASDLPARLTELEQLKTDFLTMLIKELRAPLNLLSQTVSLAHGGFYGSWAEGIKQQLLHQLTRVQNLLSRTLLGSFAMFLSHEQRLNVHSADLRQAIEEVLKPIRSICKEKTLILRVALPESPLFGEIDLEKVSRIARELLDNAVSFTPAGGRIDLELSSHPTGFALRVSDTGCGIPQEQQKWLTRHLVNGQKVGLGLALVQHYVDLLGGTVRVKSAEDQGSEFTVILPWHKNSRIPAAA